MSEELQVQLQESQMNLAEANQRLTEMESQAKHRDDTIDQLNFDQQRVHKELAQSEDDKRQLLAAIDENHKEIDRLKGFLKDIMKF